MKVGDVVQYKSNAFTGIAPGSYGAGIIISIKDPVVDFDTGKVWSNKVVNVCGQPAVEHGTPNVC